MRDQRQNPLMIAFKPASHLDAGVTSNFLFSVPAVMKRILLVDDSRAVRLAAKRILAAFDFEALEAEHGEEALRVLKSAGPIDAVLLDWNMPIMDGLTFLKTLRADTSLKQPRVVMCTTENDLHRIVEAIQCGADEYIMKPFTEEIIRDKLHGAGVL